MVPESRKPEEAVFGIDKTSVVASTTSLLHSGTTGKVYRIPTPRESERTLIKMAMGVEFEVGNSKVRGRARLVYNTSRLVRWPLVRLSRFLER
jgi:hypothetical protein